MKNSLTFKKVTLTLTFGIAILLLITSIVLGIGMGKKTPVAHAEEEILTTISYDYDETELVVTRVGEEPLTLWGDAEFEIIPAITNNDSLAAVYATYTSGKLNGEKITLTYDEATGHYILYGMSGNFTLSGEIIAPFKPEWVYPNFRISQEIETVYYGIGVPAIDMPYVTGNYNWAGDSADRYSYVSDGWSVSGIWIKDGEKQSYSGKNYIPENAISAKCAVIPNALHTVSNMYNKTPTSHPANNATSLNTPISRGVYLGNDGVDKNDGGSVSNGNIADGHKEGWVSTLSCSGIGFYKKNMAAGYNHYMLMIPVYIDGEVRQAMLSGKATSATVTVTAKIQVANTRTGGNTRSSAWVDVQEGIRNSLAYTISGNDCTAAQNYPSKSWPASEKGDANCGAAAITKLNGTDEITKTVTASLSGSANGFRIGFRAVFYMSGSSACEHLAVLNSLTYKVEAAGYSTTNILNLNSNNPIEDGADETITSNSLSTDTRTMVDAPWSYDGYEFTGWSTDSEATIGDKNLSLVGTADGSVIYYAIWQKKKYAYLEYDVYSDGTNVAGLIREDQVGVFEHGSTTLTNGNTISLATADSGGNLYAGFGDPTAYSLPLGISGARQNWVQWTNESIFDTSGPIVMAYEREMETPSLLLEGASVSYGQAINLDSQIIASHGASEEREVLYAYAWFNSLDEEVTNVISQVLASGDYYAICTASIVISSANGEITLNKVNTAEAQAFTITPVELSVNWTLNGESLLSVEYNGQEHFMAAELVGEVNDEVVTATIINDTQTNVGNYTTEITAIDSTNYVVVENEVTKEYIITPVVISVEWTFDGVNDKNSIIYDASEHVVSANIINFIGEDTATITYGGDLTATNKGSYTASITAIDNSNYTIENALGLTFDWSILGIDINANWTSGEYVYNGGYQYPTLTISGFEGSDNVYFVIEFYKNNILIASKKVSGEGQSEYAFGSSTDNHVNGETIDAGEYEIRFNGIVYDTDGKEMLKYNRVVGFEGQDYAITKKSLNGTGNWDYSLSGALVGPYQYGDTILEYVKGEYALTSTLDESGLCVRADSGLADILPELEYSNNAKTSVGDYVATLSFESDNYQTGTGLSQEWSISPKEVTIGWSVNGMADLNPIFNGGSYYLSAIIGGTISGDSCSATLSGVSNAVESGNYSVEVTALSNKNYSIPALNTTTWSIKPLPVSVAWDDFDYTYNGEEQSITATINNIKGTYTCELVYEDNAFTNAGDYTAKVVGVTSANYTIEGALNQTKDWNIAKKEISIAWTIEGKEELTKPYRASAYTITASAEGIVGQDTCAINIEGDKVKTYVGTYTVNAVSISNANYVLPSVTSTTWSIAPIKVSLAWSEAQFTYDGTEKSIIATAQNLIYGDSLYFTYENNKATNAGDYIANIIGISNTNYSIEGVDTAKEWKIDKKVLTPIWTIDGNSDVADVEYDGQEHVVSAILEGVVDSEVVTILGYVGEVKSGEGALTNGNTATLQAVYLTTISGISDDVNYELASDTFEWSIKAILVSVEFVKTDLTYNGELQGVTAIVSGVAESDLTLGAVTFATEGSTAIDISYEIKEGRYYLYFNAINSGDYTAVISSIQGENKDNYTLPASITTAFNIAPLTIMLEWNAEGGVYSKSNKSATATITNLQSTDVVTVEYKTTADNSYEVIGIDGIGNVAVNVGDYLTEVISIDNTNYTLVGVTNLSTSWSIEAKAVSAFDWVGSSVTYNGNAQSLVASVVSGASQDDDGKIYDGDTLNLTYQGNVSENYGLSAISGNTATNAGVYKVEIIALGNDNYTASGIESIFQIAKATVVVTSTSNWSKTYDKSATYTAYEYDGVIGSDNVVLSAEYSNVNAGASTLTFALGGATSSNYLLAFEGLTLGEDYENDGNEYLLSNAVASIGRKSVTAIGESAKVFDGTTAINQFTVTASDIIEGDVVNVSGAYDSALVGENTIILAIDNVNYALINASVAGNITPKALVVEWVNSGASYTYNGTEQGVSVSIKEMVVGYEEEVLYSGALVGKNAGEYNVEISLKAHSNYTLSGATTSASWTITKKVLGVNWVTDNLGDKSNSDYVYGFEGYVVTYSATLRSVEAVVVGAIDGDAVNYVTKGTEQINAGNHTAEITTLDGVDKDNYELPAVLTLDWEIVKADVTGITMSDETFTYDNSLNCVGISSYSTQFGESVSVLYTGGEEENGAVNAGNYEIIATIDAGDNYNVLVLKATLVIEKATFEGVSLQDVSVAYDGEVKSISVDSTTTAFGDSVSVTYSLVGTTLGGEEVEETGNGTIKAGTYQVSATLSAGNNYNETTLRATLTIIEREIIITWSDYAEGDLSVYDGKEKGVMVAISNVVKGDDVKAIVSKDDSTEKSEIVGNGTYSYGAINAGAYSLNLESIAGADVYNYTYNSSLLGEKTFSINRRTLVIAGWTDGNKTYSDLQNLRLTYAKSEFILTPIFAEGNVIAGDEVTITEVSGNGGANVGEYTIALSLTSDQNYQLEHTTQNWYIDAKEIDLTWDKNREMVYDNTAHSIYATAKGVFEGDEVTITYEGNGVIKAGSHQVEAVSLGNDNYRISSKTAKQTLVINSAEITGIKLESEEIVYDGEGHTLAVSANKTQYGDSVNVTYTLYDEKGGEIDSDNAIEAGIYTIKATLTAGTNYVKSTLEATLTIRSLIISAPIVDGEETPSVEVESETGFVPGSVVETTITTIALTEKYNGSVRLGARERVGAIYMVSITYNNEESALNGSAIIKMAIPEELLGSDFRIVNITGGEETELEYEIDGDYVSVVTENLDTFLFIYEPTPTAYIKAYAVWIAIGVVACVLVIVAIILIAFFSKQRTIRFVSNGVVVDGNSIGAVSGRYGSKVNLPNPVKQDMYFNGWYVDEDCNEKMPYGTRLSKKDKYYAKNVTSGPKTKIPQVLMGGITFEGWYEDEACTKKANVKKMGRKNVTLYAKWGKKKPKKTPIYPWEQ